MAIDYVNRKCRAPSGMLASESDIHLLHEYVKESTSISAAQAAAAVVRVVQDAASASGAPPTSVTAAQLALNDLCKNPKPEAIDDLLVVCEYKVSFDIVDVFKLYSAAWKVVTATCLHVTESNQLPVPTRFRVLGSAMSGAENMLVEVAQQSDQFRKQQLTVDTLPALTRYLKIARFHFINAARCCKSFLNFEDLGTSSEEELVSLSAQVFRTLAHVVHACNFNERIAETVRQDITQNICPALGGIIRSVLSMDHSLMAKDGDGKRCTRLVSAALGLVVKGPDCVLTATLGTSRKTVQILAILHLLRLAASETAENRTQSEKRSTTLQGSDRCILLCREVLESSLLRTLFKALEEAHGRDLAVPELHTGLKFVDCVSLSVEQSIALVDMHLTIAQTERLEALLLSEMNSCDSARATVSHRAILKLMTARKNDFERRSRLLFAALTSARLSLSLGTGYAERRWIPLASSLSLILFNDGQSIQAVFQQYQQTRRSSPPTKPGQRHEYTRDIVVLRVVAGLFGLLISQEETVRNLPPLLSPQRIDRISHLLNRVLDFAGLDHDETRSFVNEVVSSHSADTHLVGAAIHLLPYLLDGRSASGAAVACMKLKDASIQTQHRAINILNPALMPASKIQDACTYAVGLIKRLGPVMCAPVAAFVARAASVLHQNVSPSEWQSLSSVLDLAVLTVQKSSTGEISIDSLRETSVLFHAAHALTVTCTLARSMPGRNTHATLPRGILPQVENAQARLQELQKSSTISRSLRSSEIESACTLEENACCARMHRADCANSRQNATMPSSFEQLHRQFLVSVRKLASSSQEPSGIRRHADALRDLLLVLDRTTNMPYH